MSVDADPAREPSVPADYPAQWAHDVVLTDGGTAHVRPIRPDDGDRLRRFHGSLSDRSIYFRFFRLHKQLPDDEVHHFTHVDYSNRMAFVVLLGDDFIAVGRYDREAAGSTAEVAFTVSDDHQSRGLGSLLLEDLAAYARVQGITSFYATVLTENQAMLHVFRAAGFHRTTQFDGAVTEVRFPIEPTAQVARAVEDRERVAAARSVRRLLEPASVAVVGASTQPGTPSNQLLHNIVDRGFAGPVYVVHPSASDVDGVPAFPSFDALPHAADLAVIAVPADAVLDVVEDAGRHGVRGVVVVSAGFSETGPQGAARERELAAIAHRHGMRLVGPNSLGVINAPRALNASFAPFPARHGRVAIASQSGGVGIALLAEAAERGIGLSTFVSMGNKADVSGNDLLSYWDEDGATAVVLLYLESFGNPRRFARVARRVGRRTPIVAVKSGRTSAGGRAGGSHSSALATPDLVVDALFQQTGVIRVDRVDELFDVAQLLESQPLPEGRRVGIVGNSAGPLLLAADGCDASALEVPELSPSLQAELRALAGGPYPVANPVDLGANAAAATARRVVEALGRSGEVDAVLVVAAPVGGVEPDELAAAVGSADLPSTVPRLLCMLGGAPGEAERRAHVPSYPYPEDAAAALGRVARYAAWRRRDEGSVVDLHGVDVARARAVVDEVLAGPADGAAGSARRVAPAELERLLASVGIATTPTRLVRSADEAAAAAAELGTPVAVKVHSSTVVHKSEVDGVRLGLVTPAAAAGAFVELADRLGSAMEGALVQPMVEGGVELLVGLLHDRLFGPVVLLGAGGTATELLQDRVLRITPLTDMDAAEMVRGLRTSPLLFGYRGGPRRPVAAVEDLLLRVARLAEEVPELVELDLNPVLVGTGGLAVVDAHATLEPVAARPELAIRRLR